MSKARDIARAGTALSSVDATELGYLDGVTSNVQTQLDAKAIPANVVNNSLVDAKGDILTATADNTPARLAVGSDGQVLTADSSTATGLKWAASNPGDITAVTAGTGISGGGTSGDVTITNSMATAIDAKGDLIVGTGADAFSRLAVGSNDQVLIADSTQATGVKWGSAPTPAAVGVSCYNTNDINVSNSTWTSLTWATERFDTSSFHDTTTNTNRITIPSGKSGKYLVHASGAWTQNATGLRWMRLLKNGTEIYRTLINNGVSATTSHEINYIIDLVATDYIAIEVYQSSGGTLAFLQDNSSVNSQFAAMFLGA